MAVSTQRARRAGLLVSMLFACLGVASAASSAAGVGVVREALSAETWEQGAFTGVTEDDASSEGAAEDGALDESASKEGEGFVKLNEVLGVGESFDYLSSDFTSEVLDTSGFETRWDERSKTVGLFKEGKAAQVFESCRQTLRAKGWQECGSSQTSQATFQKSEGRYRWLYINSVQVGTWVTTVVQYA